ncbi:MAG: hypothetical protein LBE91_09075 [Tannerella sp.]|jgi:hypothetical protein|nr:hypothetical protein [Tannerella sp.]
MKTIKLFLFMFAIVFVCGHTRAQDDDLPYRPFKSFHNDTIRYLDYNFTIRSDQYVNKPAGAFFNDLELPIVYVCYLMMQPGSSGNDIDIVAMNLVFRKIGNGGDDGDYSKDYYIRIGLQTPVDAKNFVDALDGDERNKERNDYYYWTPQLYELLKDSKLKGVEANDCLFSDRRKLRENYTTEKWKQLRKIIESEKTKWRKINRAEKQTKKQ